MAPARTRKTATKAVETVETPVETPVEAPVVETPAAAPVTEETKAEKPARKTRARKAPEPKTQEPEAAPEAEAAPESEEPASKKAKSKSTYMLINGDDLSRPLGKYVAVNPLSAARKAARKHSRILLRKTNTKVVLEYKGALEKLATPKTILRKGADGSTKEIVYNNKPVASYVGTLYLRNGALHNTSA